ncbi:MAG: secretin and TonB N-terminal domain-containing protein [Planctomycetota bacterium]
MTGALGKLMESVGTGAETLPAPGGLPATAPSPAARKSFTIPLAGSPDESAIRVGNENGLISLAVRDAPLRHVLAMIADARGLNLVYASSTDVPVTATLDRVPIEQALDSLLSASGYTWARSGDIIYVTSLTAAEALPPDVQGRRVAVIELDFASAVDIDQTVKGLLSPVGKSWLTETLSSDNRRTSEKIVVEDLHPYVSRIEQYIAQADQPPRQVLIEAHILQVDLSNDKRAGVDLQAITRASGARITLRSAGLANAAASPGFFIEATGGDLSPVIEALISTTDAKALATPRILAINGQDSRIQIGEQLGFRVTTTTQTSTLESVEFLDVGVVLTVTPRITRDGRVLMRIKPEVSSGSVNPDTGLPEEETTELETDVLLSSGQGMVIGGLIQERDSTSVSKVPLLGSVPYAGFFFQRRQVVKSRSEIIVALVPHVLPHTPVQMARNSHEVRRVCTPLLHGPLCRYPRPSEPRLSDVMREHPPWACSHDEACCGPPALPVWATLRRLPPVEHEFPAPCETCEPPGVANRRPFAPPRLVERPTAPAIR